MSLSINLNINWYEIKQIGFIIIKEIKMRRVLIIISVIVALTLQLASATVYSNLTTCIACQQFGLDTKKSVNWCLVTAKGQCQDTGCGSGTTAISSLLNCKSSPAKLVTVNVTDNNTVGYFLQTSTMIPNDYFHIVTINNQMDVNGSDSFFYYNYGGTNLQFYTSTTNKPSTQSQLKEMDESF